MNSFPILVVEDHPASRSLLRNCLEKGGYRVSTAGNGKEALSALTQQYHPMVVADWMMPEMNGLELCQAIRGHHFDGYVYILLLTAKDSKADIVTGLDAGADDYLTKPFDADELMARLRAGKRILDLEKALKKASDEIMIMTITDCLTGAYNRRYLMERLPQELNRAMRYAHPLSVIMADIDDFKQINDRYGHQAGDLTLKKCVESFKGSVRNEVDWVARYGGEEFVIVLPETDLQGAYVVGERLRNLVSQEIIEQAGKEIHITASFGLSACDPSETEKSPESLIGDADGYLYQAKREGKNRVRGNGLE